MVSLFTDIGTSFILGLITPLVAVCALPLYPAFLSFIANQMGGVSRKTFALIGVIVTAGVISFMLLIGLVFTTLFQASLTKVIGIVSPIAFGILFLAGLLLVFNFDFTKFIPKAHGPSNIKNPYISAYSFGFFFGAIAIPCNPALIAAFFARAATTSEFLTNILNFLSFGIGLGAPLLAFSLISSGKSFVVINFLATHQRKINLVVGIFMILVSLYYIFCVFQVFGTNPVVNAFCTPLKAIFSRFVIIGSSIIG